MIESGDELEAIFAENPELLMMDEHINALLGLVYSKGEAICVYDREVIKRNLVGEYSNMEGLEEGDDPEEMAEEWISYNIEGAYLGPQTPLICEPLSYDARAYLAERQLGKPQRRPFWNESGPFKKETK